MGKRRRRRRWGQRFGRPSATTSVWARLSPAHTQSEGLSSSSSSSSSSSRGRVLIDATRWGRCVMFRWRVVRDRASCTNYPDTKKGNSSSSDVYLRKKEEHTHKKSMRAIINWSVEEASWWALLRCRRLFAPRGRRIEGCCCCIYTSLSFLLSLSPFF